MADPNSVYESVVFVDTFPWGGADAGLIDDFMRYILSAVKGRMADEHFWAWTSEPDYIVEREGRHMPSSSRVWMVDTKKNGTSIEYVPNFPDGIFDSVLQEALDGAFFVCHETGDPTQLKGSLWYLDGTTMRGVNRMRGQVNLNGRVRVGPINTKLQNASLEGVISMDEGHGTRTTADPQPASDSLEFYPYQQETGFEKDPHDDEPPMDVLVWPIRAGKFDDAGIYTPPAANTQGYGIAIDVGNIATDGVRFVISPSGIQVRATGAYNSEDHDILFNGINVRKHNHSGELYMGEALDFAAMGELTWKYVGTIHSSTLTGVDSTEFKEITLGEDPENYHPPLEEPDATEWTKFTRLYMFEVGAALSADPGDLERIRHARIAVTPDMVISGDSDGAMPSGAIGGGYIHMGSGIALPVEHIMIWQFPGDNQILPETRLRMWAGQCIHGAAIDFSVVHRMRVLAWKA